MRQVLRFLLNVVCCGVGFGLAAAIVTYFVPAPRIAGVDTKLDWLRSHAADYDVLFVGSSRMKQLEPAIFNEIFAKAGLPVKAFNFAVDGVRPPEDSYLLDQALAGRTAPLRLVIMEGNTLAMRISDEDFGTDRMTYWHDHERMRAIVRRIWSHSIKDPPSPREALIGVWRGLRFLPGHTQHWVANYARMGVGHTWSEEVLELGPLPSFSYETDDYLGKKWDGFTPRSTLPMSKAKSASYNKALVRAKRQGRTRLDPADAASQAHFARMAAIVRAHGARLVVVAPPTVSPEVFQPLSADITFLDYSSPGKYPQLFDPAMRLDNSHLNDAGSKLFTYLVAHQLSLAVVKRREGDDD